MQMNSSALDKRQVQRCVHVCVCVCVAVVGKEQGRETKNQLTFDILPT